MIVNRANLESADIGFQTRFNLAIEKMRDLTHWQMFATEVPSTHRTEQYPWVTALPQMKEWISDALFAELEAYKFSIENKFWQSGIQIKREDIEDDNLGIVSPAIDMLAENAARQPDKLIFDLLENGFTGAKGLAYDGQFFFDTDHKDGSGATQSNKATAALTATSFQDAWVAMASLQDESGEPLGITPTHVVVPPQLRAAALTIVELDRLANGAGNINYKTVQVVVINRLAAFPTRWFLFDLSKPLRPFIFQNREDLKFVAQDKLTDEHAFMSRIYRWSAFRRNNAGYGMWQTSFGSDGTS